MSEEFKVSVRCGNPECGKIMIEDYDSRKFKDEKYIQCPYCGQMRPNKDYVGE